MRDISSNDTSSTTTSRCQEVSGTVRRGCLPVGDLCGRRVCSLCSHENFYGSADQEQLTVNGERSVRSVLVNCLWEACPGTN